MNMVLNGKTTSLDLFQGLKLKTILQTRVFFCFSCGKTRFISQPPPKKSPTLGKKPSPTSSETRLQPEVIRSTAHLIEPEEFTLRPLPKELEAPAEFCGAGRELFVSAVALWKVFAFS